MTPPFAYEIAQFLKEHSTTSIWALPVGEIALALAAPDLVTSLHWKYFFSPVDGVTGKVHVSAFLIKTRFSFLPFSLLLSLFLSLLSFKSTDKRKKEREKKRNRRFLFQKEGGNEIRMKRERGEKMRTRREISDFSLRNKEEKRRKRKNRR
jgi:hypothetical protein